jgi:hypothetical protein
MAVKLTCVCVCVFHILHSSFEPGHEGCLETVGPENKKAANKIQCNQPSMTEKMCIFSSSVPGKIFELCLSHLFKHGKLIVK